MAAKRIGGDGPNPNANTPQQAGRRHLTDSQPMPSAKGPFKMPSWQWGFGLGIHLGWVQFQSPQKWDTASNGDSTISTIKKS